LLVWFGLRPVAATLRQQAQALEGPSFESLQRSLPQPEDNPQLAALGNDNPLALEQPQGDDIRRRIRPAPQARLARMVDLNEERTAMILRKWASQEEAA